MDIAGRAGEFERAATLQKELESLKELIFSEPIVEAVGRIKILLRSEGLIDQATVRRPQLGVNPSEEKQLLASYQDLKQKGYRRSDNARALKAIGTAY
jgi:dihydrodipicolinate synthase/N-acetylneuraminate lyase